MSVNRTELIAANAENAENRRASSTVRVRPNLNI